MSATTLAILWWINAIVLGYFVLLNAGYLATSAMAAYGLRRHIRRLKAFDVSDPALSAAAPPVTLIAPAYNEEATCVEAIHSLLGLEYPDYEVLVVNDGSRDGTLERLRTVFELETAARLATATIPTARVRGVYRSRRQPGLWVVDKENGGKADALNVGLNYCRTPLFCAMDADTLLERDALLRVIRPFLEDGTTVAAGGIIRIVNGSTVTAAVVSDVRLPGNWLARVQVLEYLRAFLCGRMAWDMIQAVLIISGAFGLFKRSAVVEAGGYATDTVGEDMELVVRLHRHAREHGTRYRVAFVPDPVAWTECPETLAVLGRQRDRWQRGLVQALLRHRHMLLNPRYGRVGIIAFPYFFALEAFGPVLELAGYAAFAVTLVLGQASMTYVLGFLLLAVGLGAALSIAAISLEEQTFRRYQRLSDLLGLFASVIVESCGYRQLHTLWRVRGIYSAMRRNPTWGRMDRKGFAAVKAPTQA